MPIDLSRIGIEPDDPAYQPLLMDLQGNILKGNGRNWCVFLFIRFKADDPAARGWIGDFARAFVPAAQVQEEQAAAFRASNLAERGGLFASFFLSAQGYLTLGFSYEKLPRDSQAWFNAGMQARQGALRDPRVDDWQAEFREPVDAMALLASDDEAEVRQHATDLQAQLAGIGADAWAEVGSRWFNEEQLDVEPFGYVDGASNPRFFRNDIDRAKAVGGDRWDPSAPLDLVLLKDPNGLGEESHGSFLVYRKLEQDVRGFDQAIEELARTLGTTPELAGAYAVGRFKDGTPVVLRDQPAGAHPPENNFDYSGDPSASRCPFHAHIRKTNPRGDTHTLLRPGVPLSEERGHRIVRRSVVFGRPEDIGNAPVGIHFLCYQADLARQFEFQQANWANQVNFVRQRTGVDTLIGQGNTLPEGQEWPNRWGDAGAGTTRVQVSDFVTLRGGEYFFAPSVGFLKNIENVDASA